MIIYAFKWLYFVNKSNEKKKKSQWKESSCDLLWNNNICVYQRNYKTKIAWNGLDEQNKVKFSKHKHSAKLTFW